MQTEQFLVVYYLSYEYTTGRRELDGNTESYTVDSYAVFFHPKCSQLLIKSVKK